MLKDPEKYIQTSNKQEADGRGIVMKKPPSVRPTKIGYERVRVSATWLISSAFEDD